MNKVAKLKVSIKDWIELGGDIKALIKEPVYYYNSVSSGWFIHDVVVRTITRGKNKGKEEITLCLKYNNNTDYIWRIKKFDKYYITAPIMLVPSKEVSLNKVESKLENIKKIISEFNIDSIKLKYLS